MENAWARICGSWARHYTKRVLSINFDEELGGDRFGQARSLKFCPVLAVIAGLIENHGEEEPTETSAVATCHVNKSSVFEWVTQSEPIQTLTNDWKTGPVESKTTWEPVWRPPSLATHRFVHKLGEFNTHA